jgi:hypothetical protein
LFTKTPPEIQKGRDALNYPRWFWVLAGSVATVGAVGLFVGLVNSNIAALAALWMVGYFVVATVAHAFRKDFASLGMPLIFLLVFGGLTWLNWSDASQYLKMIGL